MKSIRTLCLILTSVSSCSSQEPGLFDAAAKGDLAQLRTLIKLGADLNSTDEHHRTALHHAAANCRLQAVQLLVLQGGDRLARDDEGRTPAMVPRGCKEGNGDALMISVSLMPPRLITGEESSRWSPASLEAPWSLHHAASHGRTDAVTLLLKMGANVNATNANGDQPLNIACLRGDPATTSILLEGGAAPTLRSKSGTTPLHDAALAGNKQVIELLLKYGGDPNATDVESQATPLHYASAFGRLEAVQALVQHGAKLSLRNGKGKTALELAVENNHNEVVAFLRDPTFVR